MTTAKFVFLHSCSLDNCKYLLLVVQGELSETGCEWHSHNKDGEPIMIPPPHPLGHVMRHTLCSHRHTWQLTHVNSRMTVEVMCDLCKLYGSELCLRVMCNNGTIHTRRVSWIHTDIQGSCDRSLWIIHTVYLTILQYFIILNNNNTSVFWNMSF